jgi:CRISPR-associated protein Csd1
LYDRLIKSQHVDLPTLGYSSQKISFAIELNLDGKLIRTRDLRVREGGKLRQQIMVLPSIERSGSGFRPQFLWDNTQYVLGAVRWDEKDPKKSEKKEERAKQAFETFKQYHLDLLSGTDSEEIQAVLKFLQDWNPEKAKNLKDWEELADTNLVFIIENQRRYVHELEESIECWGRSQVVKEAVRGHCLLTGHEQNLARLHPMIKGVDGAQSKGAAIASFNKSAFCSYAKEQSYNAPLNEQDAFKYTTILNYLLRRDVANRQRIKVGDTTVVFWTERESPVESFLGMVFDPKDTEGDSEQLRLFLNAVRKGQKPGAVDYDGDILFYILGLSPNNSRLAVRFWHVCSVEQLMDRIGKHFRHLAMERAYDKEPLNPGVWHLLKETARETKDISPVLGGALMRSILEGTHYPLNLFNGVINRIRVEQAQKNSRTGKSVPNVNYLRAAICKAVLTRNFKMEVPMSLDKEQKDIAYLLGRLFAVLEKAQQGAIPGANATIKDRFYGSASATPAAVFPRLMHLATHHYKKAKFGGYYESIVSEIIDNIKSDGFPDHMNLKQQGMFSIGYYHQRNDLWRSKKGVEPGEELVEKN